MMSANQGAVWVSMLLCAMAFFATCASIPRLEATYLLPPPSGALKGEAVVLRVEDARPTKEIIAAGAIEEFRNFAGGVSLRVYHTGEPAVTVGLYDPPALTREAFQRRLQGLGLIEEAEGATDAIHLVIRLEEFGLDLVDRNWVASMRYEATILKADRMLAGQSISGRAQRLKVFGRKGADEVTSEVVTDTINRLEIERLIRKAKQMER